jgi:hypothetical protein
MVNVYWIFLYMKDVFLIVEFSRTEHGYTAELHEQEYRMSAFSQLIQHCIRGLESKLTYKITGPIILSI